jgi:hypothetical protein
MGVPPSFAPSRREAARFVRDHNASAWGEPALLLAFEQFRRMPGLLPSLEQCLGYGVMCCLRALLEVLLMPLRLLVAPWTASRRDALSAYLVLAGLTPFLVTVSSDSPMYLYSFWYHAIRGTSILKLYVIFNMCDMCERLLASFNHDATEALWFAINSAAPSPLASSSATHRRTRNSGTATPSSSSAAAGHPPPATGFFVAWMMVLSFASTAMHAFLLMLQTVTLNAALNSDDYSLIALLISNNFMEIKSLVFKKCSVEQLFQHVCTDTVERVQQLTHMAVMLLRHAQSEGFGTVQPWDLVVIVVFEVGVDFTKHFFLARYNRIGLDVYSRFHITIVWDAARTYLADELATRVLAGRGLLGAAAIGARPPQQEPHGTPTPPPSSPAASDVVTKQPASSSASPGRRAGGGGAPGHGGVGAQRLSPDDRKALRSIHSPDSFVRNPARRLGFTPFAYAAVVLWASSEVAVQLVSDAPYMAVLAVACVVALHALLATSIDGAACRFTVKSNRWQKLAPNAVLATPARAHVATSAAEGTPLRGVAPGSLESSRHRTSAAAVQSSSQRRPLTGSFPCLDLPSPAKDDPYTNASGAATSGGGGGDDLNAASRQSSLRSVAAMATATGPASGKLRPLLARGPDSSSGASRRASDLSPGGSAGAAVVRTPTAATSPLLARRKPTLVPSALTATPLAGRAPLTTSDPSPSSGHTSPQATFVDFTGPMGPLQFALGGSLDEREGPQGASLAEPASETGGSQAAAMGAPLFGATPPTADGAGAGLGGLRQHLPHSSGGDALWAEEERHDPWQGLEPMDSVYPFQRVDAEPTTKPGHSASKGRSHTHHHHRRAAPAGGHAWAPVREGLSV